MPTDLSDSSPLRENQTSDPNSQEVNSPQTGQNGTFRDIQPSSEETFGNIDPNYQLSNMQCRAITLALDGFTWADIARTLKINRKTLWRWKKFCPEFQQALADARVDRHDFAVQRCQNLVSSAAVVLNELLADLDPRIRVRAAQTLLSAAARFKPPQPNRVSSYPADPILTPPPPPIPPHARKPEPVLEPKVG